MAGEHPCWLARTEGGTDAIRADGDAALSHLGIDAASGEFEEAVSDVERQAVGDCPGKTAACLPGEATDRVEPGRRFVRDRIELVDPELIAAAEFPVIDTSCLGLLDLARAVHNHNYKVALTGEGADEWLAGYSWFKIRKLVGWMDRIPGVPLGTPLPLRPSHREEYTNFGKVEALDVFADGTWSVTDRFDLTLGLRGTREKVRSGYEALSFGGFSALGQVLPAAPTAVAFPNLLFRPVSRRFAEDTYHSAVGRVVASYRFGETTMGYASIARGRRPDIIEFPTGGNGTPNFIPAEIVLSYEVGLKGAAFGERLAYDLALFHYDYSNFQASVLNPNGIGTLTANGGNASADGGELSLIFRASEGLQAFFTYGYVDARFDERDDAGRRQTLAGNRFRLTPEHSASAGIDWRFAAGEGAEAYVRPSWNWRSQVYFEDQNQPGIEQAGYALVDLRAGVKFDGGRWDLGAFVKNAGDRQYLIDAGNTGLNFGLPTFIVGTPRTWGLTLSGRF